MCTSMCPCQNGRLSSAKLQTWLWKGKMDMPRELLGPPPAGDYLFFFSSCSPRAHDPCLNNHQGSGAKLAKRRGELNRPLGQIIRRGSGRKRRRLRAVCNGPNADGRIQAHGSNRRRFLVSLTIYHIFTTSSVTSTLGEKLYVTAITTNSLAFTPYNT